MQPCATNETLNAVLLKHTRKLNELLKAEGDLTASIVRHMANTMTLTDAFEAFKESHISAASTDAFNQLVYILAATNEAVLGDLVAAYEIDDNTFDRVELLAEQLFEATTAASEELRTAHCAQEKGTLQ
jgi:hypothetical protein